MPKLKLKKVVPASNSAMVAERLHPDGSPNATTAPPSTNAEDQDIIDLVLPLRLLGICSQIDSQTDRNVDLRMNIWLSSEANGHIALGPIPKRELYEPFLENYQHMRRERDPEYESNEAEMVIFKSMIHLGAIGQEPIVFPDSLNELTFLSLPEILYHKTIINILGYHWESIDELGFIAPTLILEFADQGSLSMLVKSGISMSFQTKMSLCLDVMRALYTCHRELTFQSKKIGLHHGDLKPEYGRHNLFDGLY